MPIPEKIPILRMEDYHTHYIGKTTDGRQFFGYETFVFPEGVQQSDWQSQRKEYVVVFLFNSEGELLESDHSVLGKTSETPESVPSSKLSDLLSKLGEITYCDIIVKPFSVEIDGHVFGLVPNYEHETVDLEPSSTISFQDPWDGEYYT